MSHSVSNKIGATGRKYLFSLAFFLLMMTSIPGKALAGHTIFGTFSALPELRPTVPTRSPAAFQSTKKPAAGKFLIAGQQLKGRHFSKTVVLLLGYSFHGAKGLIINRPMEMNLSNLFPEVSRLRHRKDVVYYGGPVGRAEISLLFQSKNPPGKSLNIFKDIFMSSNRKVLERLIENGPTDVKFRVYAGYAGWAPGQLDREIARGGWQLLEADTQSVFSEEQSGVWKKLLNRSSGKWTRLQAPPETKPRNSDPADQWGGFENVAQSGRH